MSDQKRANIVTSSNSVVVQKWLGRGCSYYEWLYATKITEV